jgi:hypothetical protein
MTHSAQPFHLLGIRHHGPGSARNVLEYLNQLKPDCILIELPEECSALMLDPAHPELVPPVAILLYQPKNLSVAAFYPFAAYSPEWQAMQYAAKNKVETRAIDLPFGVSPSANLSAKSTLLDTVTDAKTEQAVNYDPFLHIAQLDGFNDSERWWESRIERQNTPVEQTFDVIFELMHALRESKDHAESIDTQLREANMRAHMRLAQKEGFKTIAVICGAWHLSALHPTNMPKASLDAALLKGLKKAKIEASWIPWSFERLSLQSGYRAGVLTPAWYQTLHTQGSEKALISWISEAVRLLRNTDLPLSTAHAIEAIRLADTLAILRGTSIAGIDELTEASVSVLCHGNETLLAPVKAQLIIGDVIGQVPKGLNSSPLKSDFDARVTSARMKLLSIASDLNLDLRENAHLKKSTLLHQLNILGVDWGVLTQSDAKYRKGGFHEDWKLQWQPEFELKWIELSFFGSTILDAAHQMVLKQIKDALTLESLVHLLTQVIKADMTNLIDRVLSKLKEMSIGTTDTLTLASVVLPLAELDRYGSARAIDTKVINEVLDDLIPRVCIQMPTASHAIDEEVAIETTKAMLKINRAVSFTNQQRHKPLWHQSLMDIATNPGSAAACQGLAYKLLFDQGVMPIDQVALALSQIGSVGQEPADAALWLEGFLQGNALLLIHHPIFFDLLDQWLSEIEPKSFMEILPVLRRAFSPFSEPERYQLIRLSLQRQSEVGQNAEPDLSWDQEQADAVRNANDWLF